MSTKGANAATAVFATTLDKARKQLALEIVQGNPLLTHLYRQGAVRYDGGGAYRVPVVLRSMSAAGIERDATGSATAFDGKTYDEVPEAAVYERGMPASGSSVTPRGTYGVKFTVPHEDMDFNSGPQAVVSLVNAKKQACAASALNTIGTALYTGNGQTTNIQGLDVILDFDTVANQQSGSTFTVGGIAKASSSYDWQNQYGQISTMATDGIRRMTEVFMACSQSGSHPDIILMDPAVYVLLDELMLPNQKEMDRALFDIGFDNILFRGTPCVPDYHLAGTGKIYMLTTTGKRAPSKMGLKAEHFAKVGANPLVAGSLASVIGFHLVVDRSKDFNLRGPVDLLALGKDSDGYELQWAGMWATGSLKRQGVLDFSGSVA